MVLLAKLKELADRVLGEDQRAKHLREEELQLAAAALLVHATLIDGRADPEERRKLKSLLQVRFNLGEDEFDRILEEAEAWEQAVNKTWGAKEKAQRHRCPFHSEGDYYFSG